MECTLVSARWRRYLQRHASIARARGGAPGAPAVSWELLTLERADGGGLDAVDSGQRVRIKSSRESFLTAGPNGVLTWDRVDLAAVGVPQHFQIVKTAGTGRIGDGDEVALRTYSGLPGGARKWIAMEENGRVIGDRDQRGDWERFVFNLPPELAAFTIRDPLDGVIPTPEQRVEATIALARPAPSGGAPVTVTGPDTDEAAPSWSAPGRVVVPEGSTSTTFAIQLGATSPCVAGRDFSFSVVPQWVAYYSKPHPRTAGVTIRSRRDADERLAISFAGLAAFGTTIDGTVTLRGTARAAGPIRVTAEPDELFASATAEQTVLSPESDQARFSVETRSSGTSGCGMVTLEVTFLGRPFRGAPATARIRLPVWVGSGAPS